MAGRAGAATVGSGQVERCLCQQFPNAARARCGPTGGLRFAASYDMGGLDDDVQHVADDGGREESRRCALFVYFSHGSNTFIQRPNSRKPEKTNLPRQAGEHTYKRPKTRPSSPSLLDDHLLYLGGLGLRASIV